MPLPPHKSILIVEDDEELRRMFRYALSLSGYSITEAADGIHALRMLELERPDLILLDIGLPLLSGLDVQQEIAAHAQTRDIPIVIVTASSADLDGLGVECVLRKPVSPEEVVNVVSQCFAAHARRTDASERPQESEARPMRPASLSPSCHHPAMGSGRIRGHGSPPQRRRTRR